MSTQLQRLGNVSRNIGIFWAVITYVALAISTFSAFTETPALVTEPRGWLILALTAFYAVWYLLGYQWVARSDVAAYWKARMNGRMHGIPLRGLIYFLTIFALTAALTALDASYKYLFFVVYGVSLSIVALPEGLLLLVPTVLVLFVVFGMLPRNTSPGEILGFLGIVLTFTIYTAVVYLPLVLLKGRFERERVYRELEQSHQALAEAHKQLAASIERERELAAQRERTLERARLARDLHDTIGHSLVLMNVKLEAAMRLRAVNPARADHEIAVTQQVVRQTMAELRASLANLRSRSLSQEPLGQALARAAHEASARAGWHVTYEIDPNLGALDGETHEVLLRVGMEALTNVERHARARAVTLGLAREGCHVVLRVQDDGVGMLATNPIEVAEKAAVPVRVGVSARGAKEVTGETAMHGVEESAASQEIASPPGHYGITGMRERVLARSGAFTIGPACIKGGTLVEARLPVSAM